MIRVVTASRMRDGCEGHPLFDDFATTVREAWPLQQLVKCLNKMHAIRGAGAAESSKPLSIPLVVIVGGTPCDAVPRALLT